MTEIDFAFFNFEHGGLIGGEDRFYSSGRGYRFDGLVRVAGDQGRWPHILIMGEGDRYGYAGGEGMWEAAAVMRAAGGRPYVPLLGGLPREWGPFAPVIFVDAQSVVIRRWHDPGPRISPPASVTCWSPRCPAAAMTRYSGWWPCTGTCPAAICGWRTRRPCAGSPTPPSRP
jgi:hypothetical protein